MNDQEDAYRCPPSTGPTPQHELAVTRARLSWRSFWRHRGEEVSALSSWGNAHFGLVMLLFVAGAFCVSVGFVAWAVRDDDQDCHQLCSDMGAVSSTVRAASVSTTTANRGCGTSGRERNSERPTIDPAPPAQACGASDVEGPDTMSAPPMMSDAIEFSTYTNGLSKATLGPVKYWLDKMVADNNQLEVTMIAIVGGLESQLTIRRRKLGCWPHVTRRDDVIKARELISEHHESLLKLSTAGASA